MKTLFAAALLLGASGAAANAETFTFHSTGTVVNQVVAQPPGGEKPVVAVFLVGKTTNTWASGQTSKNDYSCANWTSTPGSIFDTYLACTFTDTNGDKASLIAGCDNNKDMTEGDCWGGLNGLDGPHKGKTGTMAWHSKNNADGKTGDSWGTGQWN
jgi:hypothetical protein